MGVLVFKGGVVRHVAILLHQKVFVLLTNKNYT